ncbi:MAG: GNAT family N-acetyltransferase [Burkholderiales bacterium]|nr:GNAT family N-acetyltransferase [Burkholderiales bacterium]
MTIRIRRIEARDEARWRELWGGYCRFYERALSEPKTRHAWTRIMDAGSPVRAIVAERGEARVIGMANYVLHESTWALSPMCCMQDLYVDPSERAAGVGKALIDWLLAECRAQGWSRLYWHTRETNYRARGLYDKYAPQSGFLRYQIDL